MILNLSKLNSKYLVLIFCLTFIFFSCQPQHPNVIISEILTNNIHVKVDTSTGKFSDWIELYNNDSVQVDISGFYITDNAKKLDKWKFPTGTTIEAYSFLIVWADDTKQSEGLHTNFSLKNKKEVVYFLNSNLEVLDSVIYGKQIVNTSYGRLNSIDTAWRYFSEPTPGALNSGFNINTTNKCKPPKFKTKGGIYNDGLLLALKTKDSSVIRYTTDLTDPMLSSKIYDDKLQIDTSTCIKARAFSPNKLPSKVVTHTYIVNENTTLPVFSITTNPRNLFDDTIGIYTVGIGTGQYANFSRGWERPINIEYFENGVSSFNTPAGVKIVGLHIRRFPQKALAVQLKKKYGAKSVKYKLFAEKDVFTYNNLVLRNSGNDVSKSFIRDGLMHSLLIGQMDIDYQSYKPVVVYLNGKYWGLYNLREKLNEYYLANNYGVDPKEIDLIENNGLVVVDGDNVAYKKLEKLITEKDLSKDAVMDELATMMDVDEYINYLIAQIYYDNTDWPSMNIKCWRPKNEDSKFRWLLFDTDFGFDGWLEVGFTNTTMDCATNTDKTKSWKSPCWANEAPGTLLIRKLLENNGFRNEFVQRFAMHISTTFKADRVIYFIDSLKGNIETDMPNQIARWGDIKSMQSWNKEIEGMRTFAKNRPGFVLDHLNNFFNLNGLTKLLVNTSGCDSCYVISNSVVLENNKDITCFKSIPLKLEAVSTNGYEFVGWEYGNGEAHDNSQLSIVPTNDTIRINAVFRQKC